MRLNMADELEYGWWAREGMAGTFLPLWNLTFGLPPKSTFEFPLFAGDIQPARRSQFISWRSTSKVQRSPERVKKLEVKFCNLECPVTGKMRPILQFATKLMGAGPIFRFFLLVAEQRNSWVFKLWALRLSSLPRKYPTQTVPHCDLSGLTGPTGCSTSWSGLLNRWMYPQQASAVYRRSVSDSASKISEERGHLEVLGRLPCLLEDAAAQKAAICQVATASWSQARGWGVLLWNNQRGLPRLWGLLWENHLVQLPRLELLGHRQK